MQKAPHADCDHCSLKHRRSAASYIPQGVDIPLIVVSDRPGIQEIIDNTTLIGEAGERLDHVLKACSINPAHIARLNAVMCMPYDNDPPKEAIQACSKRLAHEISTIKSKRIAACGGHGIYAMDYLENGTKAQYNPGIMHQAGSISWYGDRTVMKTVNPAMLLHKDAYTPNFIRHIYQALRPIERLDIDAVKYIVMTPENAEQLIAYIDQFTDDTPMAFDTETDYLQIWDTPDSKAASFLCAVLAFDTKMSIIIPAGMMYQASTGYYIKYHLERWLHKYHIITQNGKYDQNVMSARFGITFEVHDDTMAMHYALQEIGAHDLKNMAIEYLGLYTNYETELDEWFKDHGMGEKKSRRYSQLPKDMLYRYAAKDGACTFALWYFFKADLLTEGLWERPYRQTFIPTINMLSTAEQTGIGIDRQQLKDAGIILNIEIEETERAMNDYILALIDQYVYATIDKRKVLLVVRNADQLSSYQRDRFLKLADLMLRKRDGEIREKGVMRYNPNSPQQTSIIIYDILGLQLTKRLLKETSTNTHDDALNALPSHPWIELLKHSRHVHKMHDTYVVGIARRTDTDDILHVDFKFTGTEIGRLSAENGDHGIPRPSDFWGTLIRSLFICKSDERLIVADFSQAELRAFAILGNVKFLLDKYHAGLDVHDETSFMLERLGAKFFQGFALLHEWKKKLEDPKTLLHIPTYLPDFIPDIKDPILSAYDCWHIGDESGYTAHVSAILDMIAHKHKEIRTTAKNINFGGLVYQGGPAGISGMIGGSVTQQEIKEILQYYKPQMPEAAIYAESQYQLLRKHGYVETAFGRRRRFSFVDEHNENEVRKAVVHAIVAGSAADLNNHSAVRLVKHRVKVCHLVHDSIIMRADARHAERIAELAQQTMIDVGNEFMPGVPWGVDIDRLSDGSLPTRWVEPREIPEKYRQALASSRQP